MASLDFTAGAVGADAADGSDEIDDDGDDAKEEQERQRRRQAAALLWEKMRSAASPSTRSVGPLAPVASPPARLGSFPAAASAASATSDAAVCKSPTAATAASPASMVGAVDAPEPIFVWNDETGRDERKTTPEHTVFVVSGVATTVAAVAATDVLEGGGVASTHAASVTAAAAFGENSAARCQVCAEHVDDCGRPPGRAHDPARDDDKNSVAEKTQRHGDAGDSSRPSAADGDTDTSDELDPTSHLSIDASSHVDGGDDDDDEPVAVGLFGEVIASPPRAASTRRVAWRSPLVDLRVDTGGDTVVVQTDPVAAAVPVAPDRALQSAASTGSLVNDVRIESSTALKSATSASASAADGDGDSAFGVETAFHESARRRRLLAAEARRHDAVVPHEAPTRDAPTLGSSPRRPLPTRCAGPAGVSSRERLRQAEADAAVRAAELAAERKRAYRAGVLALGNTERKAAEEARRHQIKLRAELERKAAAAVALTKKEKKSAAATRGVSLSPKPSVAPGKRTSSSSSSSKTGDRKKKRSRPETRTVCRRPKVASHPPPLVRSPPPPPPLPSPQKKQNSFSAAEATAATLPAQGSPRPAPLLGPCPLPSASGARAHSWKEFSSRPRASVGAAIDESSKAPDLLLTLFAVQSGELAAAGVAEPRSVALSLDSSSASVDSGSSATSIANTETKRSGGVKRKEATTEAAKEDDDDRRRRRAAPTVSQSSAPSLSVSSLSAQTNVSGYETGTSGDTDGAQPTGATKRMKPTVASDDETRERREAEDENRQRAVRSTDATGVASTTTAVADVDEKGGPGGQEAEVRAELKREIECIERRITSLVRYCERQRPTASAIGRELAEIQEPGNAAAVGVRHQDLVRYAHAHICASLTYTRLKTRRLRSEYQILICHYNNTDEAPAVGRLQELSCPYREGVYIRRILNLERKLYESSKENRTSDRTDAELVAFRSPFFVDDLGKLFGSPRHKWRTLIRAVIRRRDIAS